MDLSTAGPALSRVGLERVDAVVLLATDGGSPRPLPARLQCFIEPDPVRGGAEQVRFEAIVSDVLREAVTGRDVFVCAAQRNTETIHARHVTAERDGLLGDLRRELRTGEAVAPGMSLRAWLDA